MALGGVQVGPKSEECCCSIGAGEEARAETASARTAESDPFVANLANSSVWLELISRKARSDASCSTRTLQGANSLCGLTSGFQLKSLEPRLVER